MSIKSYSFVNIPKDSQGYFLIRVNYFYFPYFTNYFLVGSYKGHFVVYCFSRYYSIRDFKFVLLT